VAHGVHEISAMGNVLSDLRFGIRQLRKNPGFTAVAVLILALGIGGVSAVFTVADAALVRPLPGVADPGRLVTFYRVQANQPYDNLSYPDYLDFRDRNRSLSGLAAHCSAFLAFRHDTASRLPGDLVTGNYFEVLGVKPAFGRLLLPSDDRPGALPVAVLGYGLWQRQFGGGNVAGAGITLNGHPFTVVGVAPQEFGGTLTGQSFDVWAPLSTVNWGIPRLSQNILEKRSAGWLDIFGRLKPDATYTQAGAEIRTIAGQLAAAYPVTNGNRSVTVLRGIGLYPDDRAEVGALLSLLAAAAGLLLLIVCSNVAGLCLLRARGRQREIAVRLAVGAGRGRIVRQLLTEALLLSALAGAAGALLSVWAAGLMAAIRPGSALRQLDIRLDARVLGFGLLAAVVTALTIALLPALQSLPADLTVALKDGAPGAGARRSRLQRLLVAGQLALSFLLLSAAGLLLEDLHRLATARPGYETSNLAIGSIDLELQGYPPERGERLYTQLMDRLSRLPGVVSASLAGTVPPVEWPGRVSIFHPGEEPPPQLLDGREMELGLRVDINHVAPNYFRTMGIGLLEGRDFRSRDERGAPAVAIINQTLARQWWPGGGAIGQHISCPTLQGAGSPLLEVIGVAADTKSRALTTGAVPFLYLPLLQNYDGRANLVVRTAGNPGAAVGGMEQTLQGIDRDLALFNAHTMSEHVARTLWQQRTAAAWTAGFSTLALVLAAIGLYAVMAQSVTQRRREVGIRTALGAAPAAISRLIVREGMVLVLVGVALGVPAAFSVADMLAGMIPGAGGVSAWILVASALVLSAVALLACWIPARHAARIDPVDALRSE
jgi:macrolide transport system ATP-binding/permease protein